jgi:tRNA G18 (ribose-2'-O)-methylase SpoU
MKDMRKLTADELGRHSVAEAAAAPKMGVAVVLDNVRSLNNVGSFFRTCDAFAVEILVLCGITGSPPDREIHKTALGAELTVPWTRFETTVEAVEWLIDEGYYPVAVEQVRRSRKLSRYRVDYTRRYALVFGNEVDGVAQEVIDTCAEVIEIPQAGTKHSLNVAVSGGVVLWHFFRTLRPDIYRR